ncbi:hypothetical protein ABZY02_35000, partial [Streptomyces sp. NPDC006649]|uniref:hypothetical protein n=1 Tax=Streptomyces sp. NPDC006649 TaxID=3156896 RepID=UPI0033B91C6E
RVHGRQTRPVKATNEENNDPTSTPHRLKIKLAGPPRVLALVTVLPFVEVLSDWMSRSGLDLLGLLAVRAAAEHSVRPLVGDDRRPAISCRFGKRSGITDEGAARRAG